MGVPFLLQQQDPADRQAEGQRAAVDQATQAADASIRSLSSLLLAARAATAPLAVAEAAGSQSVRLQAARFQAFPDLTRIAGADAPVPFHRAPPLNVAPPPLRVPPPNMETYQPGSGESSPSSPPPLAPPSDTESEPEWDDLPSLLSESPHSEQGLDDLFCPWAPRAGSDRPMREAGPSLQAPSRTMVLRPSAFRTSFFGGPASRGLESVWTRDAGRAPRHRSVQPAGSSLPAQATLDAKLTSLAGTVAQLVHVHRQQLGAADPHVGDSLRDVANQLAALSNMLRSTGPPA